MDEIYGLSVWAENSTFHIVLSLKDIPDPNKTHFVWSFSKVSKTSLIQIKLTLYVSVYHFDTPISIKAEAIPQGRQPSSLIFMSLLYNAM